MDTASDKKVVSQGYKYFMIFLCMLTQAIPYGIAQNIQPLFVHPLVNTFHFTLASYTLIFTFGAVAASIASPFIGKGLGKVNFKVMYMAGIIISALAYVIFGISTKLPGFYGAAILCMIGSTFFSGQGVPWVINHWFPGKGRGTALGVAFCGGSIGNIFLQPITQKILASNMVGGAKTGHLTSMKPFFIFAVALFIIGLIITLFIRTPKDDEIVASAEELKAAKEEAAAARANMFPGWTAKEVMKMPAFWIFSIGFLIIGIGLASLNEDYAAFLDTKLSLGTVGFVGAMYGVGCLIGNVGGGVLFDKLGTAKAMTFAGIMYVISIVMMIMVSLQPFNTSFSKYCAIAYAFFCGFAVFSYMSGPAFMSKDLFGAKEEGVMLGLVGLAYAIGFAIGAPLFGVIKGMANFTVAWYVMLACVIVGFVLLILAVIKIKKMQKAYMANMNNKQ
ncbi:MAG: conjugated bile salt MFS transporter [Candidatus Paralactobacillus gallistercoris]|uniref:Conjugated bile salt MFS transporter n=1 Tax=Candidatus Paralactobacillus gallistercoris TaxID=2838724 RepID=A0A948TKI1_9LACO|nr:conjugated bile salt MFS transporter [Candidatus Paralactobacillus gallistercoris]